MNKIQVYLDSMVFIYLFEEDSRYIKKVNRLFKQIEKGDLSAVTSIITTLEVLSAPKLERDQDKLLAFARFFQKTPNLTVYDVNWEIMEKAASLRRENPHLRTPDSLQIATAIISGSKTFITNDEKLINLKTESLKKLLVEEIDSIY